MRPCVRGSDPGRLNQDHHLDDGEAERADGPEDADRPGAADELRLVETGKVGEVRRHRHPRQTEGQRTGGTW